MDEPTEEILLRVAKIGLWEKAKADLIALAATQRVGSQQNKDYCEAVEQFVEYIESNNLNQ